MTLYLSRLTLDRAAPAAALTPLLDPDDPHRAADAHHRLVWTLFADGPDRTRDFLWRADGAGRFYTLSRRPPRANELFEPPETKPFEPVLAAGDRLAFTLRANVTRSVRPDENDRSPSGRIRVKHRDLVMDALYPEPGRKKLPPDVESKRPLLRPALAHDVGTTWLAKQGLTKGFEPIRTTVEGYDTLEIARRRNCMGARFGILDMTGTIRITDPDAFGAALATGFGRAKAWGCGLMLIRRA
jgi:CRISPR system Cascade subunit CasE